jgi:hypothetical protein
MQTSRRMTSRWRWWVGLLMLEPCATWSLTAAVLLLLSQEKTALHWLAEFWHLQALHWLAEFLHLQALLLARVWCLSST